MFLTGAAGLAWQSLWTTQLSIYLGHDMVAVLAVMAAFFAGLALGAYVLGARIARSAAPWRWYLACEVVIGLWGLLLSQMLPTISGAMSQLIGAEPLPSMHWLLAFSGTLILLLPATAAMGATLPAVERQLCLFGRVACGHNTSALYAANTAGAVLGLLLTTFFLLPRFGLHDSAMCWAGVNLFCAAVAGCLWWGQSQTLIELTNTFDMSRRVRGLIDSARTHQRHLGLMFATGLLSIGYEVWAVRLLSQVTENTVYSYALLLAVYLSCTAFGAVIYQRRKRTQGDGPRVQRLVLSGLACALLLGGLSLWQAQFIREWPGAFWGHSTGTALAGEALAGGAALILPSLLMGFLFSHLCSVAQAQGVHLGAALAFNTLGAALAPVVVGLLLLPLLGAQVVLAILVLGYLALQPTQHWRRGVVLVPLLGLLACVGLTPSLRLIDIPDGGRLLSHKDGVMAAVSVVQDSAGVAHLHINNRAQEGSSAPGQIELRLAQLPLMLHPSPSKVLMLGLGTGFTASTAAADIRLHVTAVELLPEVIAARKYFLGTDVSQPQPQPPPPPLRTVNSDARRFVQADKALWDVVVSDLFHPARSGAGSLYTVEHFQAVRHRLAPGGLYCQWLALHQMDLTTLRSIVAAFLQVYPQASAVLASNSLDTPVLGLIARPDAVGWRAADLRLRIDQAIPHLQQVQVHLEDEFAVLGSVVAGPTELAAFAQGALANSDDRAQVHHTAPWHTYAPQETPRARLLALLQAWQRWPERAAQVLDGAQGDTATRLQNYWAARLNYLRIGAAVQPQSDPAAMLKILAQPLLNVLQQSRDFRPAYDPLLAMARASASQQPALAREVLAALQQAHPHREEAGDLLSTVPVTLPPAETLK